MDAVSAARTSRWYLQSGHFCGWDDRLVSKMPILGVGIAFACFGCADNLAGAGVVSCSVRRLRENRTLAGGGEAEFSAFVARDGGKLLGFAFLLTGNRHDAEDLVQQALRRTAVRWPVARQSPAGYSRTVVLNLVRDRWRAQQRQRVETLSPDLTALPSAVDGAAIVLDRQMLLDRAAHLRRGTAPAACCRCSSELCSCCGSGRTGRWKRQRPCLGARPAP